LQPKNRALRLKTKNKLAEKEVFGVRKLEKIYCATFALRIVRLSGGRLIF